MATVLVIPDLHCPHHHEGAPAFLKRLAAAFGPDRVVCLGDEIDAAGLSRFAKDPDAPSAGDELGRACDALRPFFDAFPDVRVCESNHTWRPYKRALEVGIPARCLRPVRSVLGAPMGWRWSFEWKIDGVHYRHGDGLSGVNCAKLAAERYGVPMVFGHVHSVAAIHRRKAVGGTQWAMATGCLVNPAAPAFGYAKCSAYRPVLGAAVVKDGAPFWFPLE